jgi:hypothetical protein
MRSFAIAALVSVVAANANVYTVYSTKTDSIISCAPDVTDCPGSSTAYSYHATETSTCTTTTDEAHPTAPVYTTSAVPAYTTSSAPVYTWTSTADAHPAYSTSTCTDEEEHATETGAVKPSTLETYTKPSKPTYYATVTGATGGKASASASGAGMCLHPKFSPPLNLQLTIHFLSGKASSASGYAKASTGAAYPTAPAYAPKAAQGDASAIRAAGALAGAGAILAFLL